MRSHFIAYSFAGAVAVAAVLALGGCGVSQQLPAPDPGAAGAQAQLSLELPRLASASNTTGFAVGAEYDRGLPVHLATVFRSSLKLARSTQISGSAGDAYAMYSFGGVGSTCLPQLEVDWAGSSGLDGGEGLWIGLANWQRGRWDWYHLQTTKLIQLDSLEPYISSEAVVLAAALSHGPGWVQVHHLQLGLSEWLVEQAGPWQAETTDIAAAIDSRDQPHYIILGRYAHREDGIWQSGDSPALSPYKLELDENDLPRCCGVSSGGDWGMEYLAYAAVRDSGWETYAIDRFAYYIDGVPFLPRPRVSISMDFDASGRPHFAYFSNFQPESQDLVYAMLEPGDIVASETIETVAQTDGSCSLTLDDAGSPHIFYNAYGEAGVRYASREGGSWAFQTLIASGGTGVAAAFSPGGKPMAACTSEDAQYFLRQGLEGWQPVKLGIAQIPSAFCSMLTQPGGAASVLFANPAGNLHKLMEWNTTSWESRWVSLPEGLSTQVTPRQNGFVLDSSGRPHLIFVDASSLNVYHAYIR